MSNNSFPIPIEILKQNLDGHWEIDPEHQKMIFGLNSQELFGPELDDIDSFKDFIEKVVVPEDRQKLIKELSKAIQKGTSFNVPAFRCIHKGGHHLWVWMKGHMIQKGPKKNKKLVGTFFNVDEIKKKEEVLIELHQDLEKRYLKKGQELIQVNLNLRRRNGELEAIFKVFPDKILILDKNATLLTYEMSANHPHHTDFAGNLDQKLDEIYPQDVCDRYRELANKLIGSSDPESEKGPSRSATYEKIEYLISGPETHFFEARVVPYDENKILVLEQDVTEHKELEDELEKQRLGAIEANRLAGLGQMAGGIAHEINNPLTIVLGHVDYLEDMAEQNAITPEGVLEHSGKIKKMVMRMASIVRGLRTFARDGSQDPTTLVRVKELIGDTLEVAQGRYRSSGVPIEVNEFPPELSIACRGVQISQVLVILLNNAFDAVMKLQEKWVRVEVKDLKEQVEIAITDSGKGIAPEIREKILTPFFTTKSIGQGTGLGLSIAQGIVESHHGKLRIDEECPNTRFVLHLNKSLQE